MSDKRLLFHFEGTLLKSTSLFPYFMLVAIEAGSLLRSLILLLSYPLVYLVGEDEMGLKIMAFLCFFGIKKDTFRIGSAVLPKFFLEDVDWEGFQAVMPSERKVAVSKLPRIMVEDFLKDYIGVEAVVAKDMKSFAGYFLGLMKEQEDQQVDDNKTEDYVIGLGSRTKCTDKQLFNRCKDQVYLVDDTKKRNWHVLPRERYPKPLIFHDGRLAFKPNPASSLALFMWIPFGLVLSVIRVTCGVLLPLNISTPVLAFTGTRTTFSTSHNCLTENKKVLYVCNHRTLLDPLYISLVLDKPISAVVYSLSRFNELISPIKTIRLTRDREKDRKTMENLLNKGNLVVCPEGTTCREPYLLRFSPLFAELTDDIVPVALNVIVTMFYGTTAAGHKWLDPFFHFMNPNPMYVVKILEKLPESDICQAGGKSRIEVANYVQKQIADALGFECTRLTRKDKYMILAGNEGICQEPPWNGRGVTSIK